MTPKEIAESLLSAINVKTSKSDTNLTAAIQTLVDGYGGKNVQAYQGMGSVRTTSYTATGVKLTIAKSGTYKVSWIGIRNTNSGTNGTQLYIAGKSYGSATTSFTNTYAQSVVLNNVKLTAGQTIEVYGRARSTSYYMMAGNLVIEEQ